MTNDELNFLSRELSDIEKYLTPDEKTQVESVLKGECPHNRGWSFHSYGHNDKAYQCNLCKKLSFY